MRALLTLSLAVLLTIQAKSQNVVLGTDDNPIINKTEGEFLDSLLQVKSGAFELTNKRIAFIYGGSTGNAFQTKSAFFNENVLPWTSRGRVPHLFLVPLTEAEKKKSGGYDAIIVAWAKVFTKGQKEKMLSKLARED